MFDHGNGFNTLPGANKLSFGSLNHRLSSPSRPSSHSDDSVLMKALKSSKERLKSTIDAYELQISDLKESFEAKMKTKENDLKDRSIEIINLKKLTDDLRFELKTDYDASISKARSEWEEASNKQKKLIYDLQFDIERMKEKNLQDTESLKEKNSRDNDRMKAKCEEEHKMEFQNFKDMVEKESHHRYRQLEAIIDDQARIIEENRLTYEHHLNRQKDDNELRIAKLEKQHTSDLEDLSMSKKRQIEEITDLKDTHSRHIMETTGRRVEELEKKLNDAHTSISVKEEELKKLKIVSEELKDKLKQSENLAHEFEIYSKRLEEDSATLRAEADAYVKKVQDTENSKSEYLTKQFEDDKVRLRADLIRSWENEVSDLNRKNSSMRENYDRDLFNLKASLQSKHANEMKEISNQAAKREEELLNEVEVLKLNQREETAKLKRGHENEIYALRTKFEGETGSQIRKLEHDITTLKNIHQQDIFNLKSTNERLLINEQNRHSEELSSFRHMSDEEILRLRQELDDLNRQSKYTADERAENVRNDWEKRLESFRLDCEERVRCIRAEYDGKIDGLRHDHQIKSTSLISQFESQINALKTEQSTQIARLKSDHESELLKIKTEAASTQANEKLSVEAKYNSSKNELVRSYESQITELSQKLDSLKRESDHHIKMLKSDTDSLSKSQDLKHADELKSVHDALEARFLKEKKEIENSYISQREYSDVRLKEFQTQHERQVREITLQYEEHLRVATSQADSHLKQVEAAHENQMAAIRKAADQELNLAKLAADRSEEWRENRLSEISKESERVQKALSLSEVEIYELKKSKDDILAELEIKGTSLSSAKKTIDCLTEEIAKCELVKQELLDSLDLKISEVENERTFSNAILQEISLLEDKIADEFLWREVIFDVTRARLLKLRAELNAAYSVRDSLWQVVSVCITVSNESVSFLRDALATCSQEFTQKMMILPVPPSLPLPPPPLPPPRAANPNFIVPYAPPFAHDVNVSGSRLHSTLPVSFSLNNNDKDSFFSPPSRNRSGTNNSSSTASTVRSNSTATSKPGKGSSVKKPATPSKKSKSPSAGIKKATTAVKNVISASRLVSVASTASSTHLNGGDSSVQPMIHDGVHDGHHLHPIFMTVNGEAPSITNERDMFTAFSLLKRAHAVASQNLVASAAEYDESAPLLSKLHDEILSQADSILKFSRLADNLRASINHLHAVLNETESDLMSRFSSFFDAQSSIPEETETIIVGSDGISGSFLHLFDLVSHLSHSANQKIQPAAELRRMSSEASAKITLAIREVCASQRRGNQQNANVSFASNIHQQHSALQQSPSNLVISKPRSIAPTSASILRFNLENTIKRNFNNTTGYFNALGHEQVINSPGFQRGGVSWSLSPAAGQRRQLGSSGGVLSSNALPVLGGRSSLEAVVEDCNRIVSKVVHSTNAVVEACGRISVNYSTTSNSVTNTNTHSTTDARLVTIQEEFKIGLNVGRSKFARWLSLNRHLLQTQASAAAASKQFQAHLIAQGYLSPASIDVETPVVNWQKTVSIHENYDQPNKQQNHNHHLSSSSVDPGLFIQSNKPISASSLPTHGMRPSGYLLSSSMQNHGALDYDYHHINGSTDFSTLRNGFTLDGPEVQLKRLNRPISTALDTSLRKL